LLLGLGLVIGKQLAWILIAVALTALVLLAIGGAYATTAEAEPKPSTIRPGTITVGKARSRVVQLGPTPQEGRLMRDLERSLAAVRGPSPALREWLEHEQERGSDLIQSIKTERVRMLQATSMPSAVAQFGPGARIRTLATNISSWSRAIGDRVTEEVSASAAAPFQGDPKPIQGAPTSGDLDRLESYVRERDRAIADVLGLPHQGNRDLV
jgi:hypothetical protein